MRSLRLAAVSLFALAMVSMCTVPALANPILNMALVGVSGNNAGGFYTYPYYLTINGGSQVSMICDSFDDQVGIPDFFKATESGLLSGKGMFANRPNSLLDYKAAGLIFLSILKGTLDPSVGNYAIWGLFSTSVQGNAFFQSSNAASIEQQYLSLAAVAPNGEFAGLHLYTPLSGGHQEYIGFTPTPEPGTMALMGSGILFLAGKVRRKRRLKEASA